MEVPLDWEGLVAIHYESTGDKVSDSIRCATVLGWTPRHVEEILRSRSASIRHSYADMKTAIPEFCVGRWGATDYVPIAAPDLRPAMPMR